MKVITLLNEKGGVGKTTLAVHIAAGLAVRGYRVVLVDTDPQGGATTAVHCDREPGIYDLLVRHGTTWQQVLRPVNRDVYALPGDPVRGVLVVLPSNIEAQHVATSISDGLAIRKRLAELANGFDYAVIDTSPTPSLLHAAILMATDFVLVPTNCEVSSAVYAGVADSVEHIRDIREAVADRGLVIAQLAGIVPVMRRGRLNLHNQVVEYLRQSYPGHVWPSISQSVVFGEAAARFKTVFNYAPGSKSDEQMQRIVERVSRLEVAK